jgi:hypothetical protein
MAKDHETAKKDRPPKIETSPAFRSHPPHAELYAMGKSDEFDQAVAEFSIGYADQSEHDREILMKAVHEGRLEVFVEESA